MVFLHINENSKNHEKLDDCIKAYKQVFLLIFMIGCGPCEDTKPHWLKLENNLHDDYKSNEDIIIADLDQSLLSNLKNLPKQPLGFPSMYYITNGGKTCEEYNSERDIKSFIKWIELKSKKQKGGSKMVKTINKNTRKKYNKKNKKSKKSKKSKKIKKSKHNSNRRH